MKTFHKNIWREIKQSLSRFLAIFSIVALGVGFLAGLLATTPDMRFSVDAYYDKSRMMDIRLISTLGLTAEDVNAIRSIDGVQQIMPVYTADTVVQSTAGDTFVARLQSLPQDTSDSNENYLNRLELVSGRMPQKPNECVVVTNLYSGLKINLGDTLAFTDDNKNLSDKVAVSDLTVVGIANSACYFSVEKETTTVGNGTVTLHAFTPESTFSYDVYTEFYITVAGAREIVAFSEAYDQAVAAVTDKIEAIADQRSALRTQSVRQEAQQTLDDAKAEYEDKKAETEQELEDARIKLADAATEIADAERKLADGRKELADGDLAYAVALQEFPVTIADKQAQIDSARLEIEENRQTLIQAGESLSQGQAQLDAQKASLTQAKAGLEYQLSLTLPTDPTYPVLQAQLQQVIEGLALLDSAQQQLDSGYEQGTAGWRELKAAEEALTDAQYALDKAVADAPAQFAQTKQKLEDARQELDKGDKELADAKQEYADGLADYQAGKKEADEKLLEAEDKLIDAQNQIDDIEEASWYVLDRSANPGYISFDSNAQKVAAIAQVFPVFFFLVAALVTVTTMTRMIEEQRTQIGTLKALGYSKMHIAFKYILYAGLASVGGSLFGLAVGFKLFPTVIYNAYSMMYALPPLITGVNLKYAVLSSSAAILCTLAATLNACHSSLVECPATLMLPKAPPAGKRIFLERIAPLWQRMKFTHKVTARNLLRYKKRFFMTVIGIAGCTALLVTGFGLRDSIGDIIHLQFGEIYKYNLAVTVKDESDLTGRRSIESVINDTNVIESYTLVHQEPVTLTANGHEKSSSVYVPQNIEAFSDYFVLRNRKTDEPIVFDDNAVVLTEKMAETLGLKIGDSITIKPDDGNSAQLTLTGITENYVQSAIYISSATYQKAFGTAPAFKLVTAIVPNATQSLQDDITTRLLKADGVVSISFTDSLKSSFEDMLKNIDYIVIVLIISAGLLAFIVLYNLTNINITERQRELATIKVLGFFDKEVSAYIYRETLILSIIGTAAGLVLGVFLHAFVIRTAEVDLVMFGRSIYPLSFLYSAVLTMFFSVLVNWVMGRKMKKISMVESLKANE
ncbi:MAG: FtsX-like permease family protein [Oscillospiraceae bacterium]|nr:FtsX-like permease family protein [Oscillospiraceae bacterium]